MKTLFTLMVVAMLVLCGTREAGSQTATSACIIALDASAAGSLTASGNTTVTSNCSIAVNSISPAAVALKGIATIALSGTNFISIVGGFDLSGQAHLSPAPITSASPFPDPFASLIAPSVSSTCDFANVVINDGSSTLNPGVYCGGIQVGGDATVTLSSGLYILQGGGLTVQGNSTLIGSRVTVYNTGSAKSYEPIIVGHQSIVQLSAPTTGTYAGVLFFADRDISASQTSSSRTTNVFGGGAGSTFDGALYFPAQSVLLENFTPGGCSEVIADQIEFRGDTQLNCSST